MHSDQNIFAVTDLAFHKRIVRFAAKDALKPNHAEFTMTGSQLTIARLTNEVFRLQTIANQIGHRDQFHIVNRRKFKQVGTRAMVPSSFMISQMTPAEKSPALRARSTDASVCPARTSTPPSLARKGKI
jgi:hypothetical protein